MTDYDTVQARRNASEAVLPADRTIVEDDRGRVGPLAKSDREPACTLREGHRVHFVATADEGGDDAVVRELHCADPHCDHHAHPEGVNETVSVETEGVNDPDGIAPYKDEECVYAGEAVLVADFEGGEEPRLGLTDVELATYAERHTIPAIN